MHIIHIHFTDAYMGVTNLESNQNDTHVKNIAEFAIDMIDEARKVMIDEDNPSRGFVNIRVGFHSGPVVSNVIGSTNKRCVSGKEVSGSRKLNVSHDSFCTLFVLLGSQFYGLSDTDFLVTQLTRLHAWSPILLSIVSSARNLLTFF